MGRKMFKRRAKNLYKKSGLQGCNEKDDAFEVVVDSNRVMQVNKLLHERDISYEVVGSEGNSPVGRRLRSPLSWRQAKTSKRIIDWKDYHPLNKIYLFMEDLEVIFPSTCTVSEIGRTAEGRSIKMLKISNSNATNTGVWLDGGTHAREWISVSVVTYIADFVARNFNSLPEIFTNKDWHFVPVVNPDGYHYSHTTDRMWRKSRARVGNTIVGVDLNRNFSYYWGRCNENCTNDPNGLNYRGAEPFSEPETCAIKDIILYSGVPFKIFISYHSCSEIIAFPWCHTPQPCPDYVNLLEGGTAMAKAIHGCTGRMYKVGGFRDIMYTACGTSIDWSYGTARIPFSYLMELRSKEHRFLLPKSEILDCCKESLSALQALLEFVEKKKCLNCIKKPS